MLAMTFENVSASAVANVYLDGKVVSHSLTLADGAQVTPGNIISRPEALSAWKSLPVSARSHRMEERNRYVIVQESTLRFPGIPGLPFP